MNRTITDTRLAGLTWTSKKGIIVTKLKIVGTWEGDRPDDRSSEVRTDLEEAIVRVNGDAGIPFLASYPAIKVDYSKGAATIIAAAADYGDAGAEWFRIAAETAKIFMESPERIEVELHWRDEE